MGRAIERIEQDIISLKQAIGAIATELHKSYVNYLTILGQSVEKQLTLALYHLCTQGYPEKFLKLSLNQRQQLQQSVRKLGQKSAQQLLVYVQSGNTQDTEETQKMEETQESNKDPQLQIQNEKYLDTSNPIEVAEWHEDLEEGIQDTLRKVSQDANSLIQKAGILPKKLPEQILAAAAASETSGEMIPSPPNLLNLIIEITTDEESEDSSLTQFITLNLRLVDIEFADNTLLSARKQIRNILLQLNKLGKEYQKKHRELKIAEAEAAWRASWFED